MKKVFALFLALLMALSLCACRESYVVSRNISKEADNFNIQRRLTVINARTDTVLLQLEGAFSIANNETNELVVVCELEDGTHQKHFIYLNEFTIYIVEDISHNAVSKYHYELNFLPQMYPPATITMND